MSSKNITQEVQKPIMIFKALHFKARRIVDIPASTTFNEKTRRNEKHIGKAVQFLNGGFDAYTEDEVRIVREYMKNHQGAIIEIDPKKVEYEQRVRARVMKEVAEEMRAEAVAEAKKELEAEALIEADKRIADEKNDKAEKEAAKKEAEEQKEALKKEIKAEAVKNAADEKKTQEATKKAEADAAAKIEADKNKTSGENKAPAEDLYKDKSNLDLIKMAKEKGFELSGSEKRSRATILAAIADKLPGDPDLTDESEKK